MIEREVEFTRGARTELYRAVGQSDYIAMVAQTPDKMIASLPGSCRRAWPRRSENPAETCRRELLIDLTAFRPENKPL